MLHLSTKQARRFLAAYHLSPTDVPGVLQRLGTVQYDPLNPLGRNTDLVLQARVPDYQVDEWQSYAYDRRLMYDAWDKQACLVPIQDWPKRAVARQLYPAWHDREALQQYPEVVETTLAELDRRGPLSSLEFEDRTSAPRDESWAGSTVVKRILRALWTDGTLTIHHRVKGRHYYDRSERVIPPEYFNEPPLDEDGYHYWVVARRHQAAGLLRPRAEAAIWNACGDATIRTRAIERLVEDGSLTPVYVGEQKILYHLPTSALGLLEGTSDARLVFLGPLDNMLWDRRALRQIFNFDYVWEVYKPAHLRKWGYYVLPVFYKDRFVARMDSRLEDNVWTLSKWWWESDLVPDAEISEALHEAGTRFMAYLGAKRVRMSRSVDPIVRAALTG